MPKSRITTFLLILILILAVVTRLGWPGLTEFKFDEAISLRHAARLVREGIPPPIISSSVANLPHPPLMAYLLAIPFFFWRDPEAAVLFMGAMGVAAVALTYWLGARYYGERVGLISAALFAAAPWAIFYSRKLWAMDVPLITLIMMIGLFKLIVERKWWGLAPTVICAVLLPGLYFGNIVFPVILVVVMALHWRAVWEAFKAASTRDRWLVPGIAGVGVAILLALMWPWIGRVLGGEINPMQAGSAAGESAGRGFDPLGQIWQATKIATGFEFHALAGDSLSLYDQMLTLPDSNRPDLLAMVVMVLGVGAVVYCLVQPKTTTLDQGMLTERGRTRYSLLLVWMLTPLAIWTLSGLEPQPHRYVALYPTQFLVVGILVTTLTDNLVGQRRLVRWVYGLWGLLLAALIGWWMVEYSALLRVVNATVINGGHGAAAQWMWDAAREARRLSNNAEIPIVLNGTGDNPDTDAEATAFDAMLGDLNLWLIKGEGIGIRTPDGYVHLDTRPDGPYNIQLVQPGDTSGEASAKLSNGIELLHVEPGGLQSQMQPGAAVLVSVIWRVWGQPPTGEDYNFTVQLYDASGVRHVNINEPFLHTRYWRVGDVIITSVVLRIPGDAVIDGQTHLVVSLYSLTGDGIVVPTAVIDQDFNKIGEFIEIDLD